MQRQLKGQNSKPVSLFSAGRIWLVLVAVVPLAAIGCGSSASADRPSVYPATGKISFNGKVTVCAYVALYPKANAAAPDGHGLVPSGLVRSDGTFALSSYVANDGAPAGDYAVTVEWHKAVKGSDEARELGPNLLPPQYGKSETSPVTVTIAAGPNELKPIVLK